MPKNNIFGRFLRGIRQEITLSKPRTENESQVLFIPQK